MTQVNLLPPELQQRQRTRRLTGLVVVAGIAAVVVIGFLYFLQTVRLGDVNEDLAAQEARNAELQQQISSLQKFEELRGQLEARRQLIEGAIANTVRWSGVLRDVSLVIPDRMWLTSFSGSVTATTGVTTPPEGTPPTSTQLIGNIQFSGTSLDQPTLALWLTRLEQVPGWVNAWLSSATEGAVGTTEVFTFTSSLDLSREAAQGGQL